MHCITCDFRQPLNHTRFEWFLHYSCWNIEFRCNLSHKDNYIRATDTRTAKSRSTNAGRVINELIGGNAKKNSFGAKQILLSVCDGYFMMHPTKTYL